MSATIPKTMKVIEAAEFGLEALRIVERPVPLVGPGEVLLRLSAATLNYRDLAVLTGTYGPQFKLKHAYVPASDVCGFVVATGPGVTRFQEGDRVLPLYTQGWLSGQPTPEMRSGKTLGYPLDGVLREYISVPEESAVHAPSHLTDVEAAALPIAGLTAWVTLQNGGVAPGSWVLAMGTGGVAIFALQFAKAAGARVAVISSSDDKLARAQALGADATVNYRTHPDWAPLIREATGGRGVDIVVETAGTLSQSLTAVTFGGYVGIIGFTGSPAANLDIRQVIGSIVKMQGISTGPRSSFEAMNRAVEQHRVKPVVEQVFPMTRAQEAFALMQRGGHFGKIGIRIAEDQ